MTTPDAATLWKKASAHLERVLRPDVYSRWIAVIEPVSLEGSALALAVDNDFYQTWLEENYLSLIQNAVRACHDGPIDISFVIRKKDVSVQPQVSASVAPSGDPSRLPSVQRGPASPRLDSSLNPKFIFDTFIVGSSNTFTHAAALAVAQAPARAYNPLFIYGGVGLGKTHIMQAIGQYALSTSRATVCYLSSEALLNQYIDALQGNFLVQFRKKYRSADLLLIDDIHFLAGKERIQEEFFHTFNALFDAHKQIVMTSDRPASEIARLEQRLVSRFEWGLVTELQPPDLETRIAILRRKQGEANLKLDDEFLYFIAQNIRSNIRRLEGALIRTLSYASLMRKPLTIEAVRYLLRDMIEQEEQEDLTFDRIQRAVAEYYDLRLTDMSSKRRPRSIAVPRQVAMFLCRRLTRSSLPDIANAFGKTHATVLHACRTVVGRLDVDSDLRQSVLTISDRLGRPLQLGSTQEKTCSPL